MIDITKAIGRNTRREIDLLSPYIEELKEKYGITTSNVYASTSGYDIRAYIAKYKDTFQNTVITNDDDENLNDIIAGINKTDNHIAILDYFPIASLDNILVIFYESKEILDEELTYTENTVFPVGNYSLKSAMSGYVLDSVNISESVEPILNENIFTELTTDINRFFSMKQFYQDNKFPFRRGVLLYGPPGTGKSSSIRHLLKEHPDKYGIIFDCSKSFDTNVSQYLAKVTDKKPIIFILEDIDGVEGHMRSELLNLLDGLTDFSNVFFIATTNHIDRIDAALTNRPSRFDRIYLIDNPNLESRKLLIKRYFPELSDGVVSGIAAKTENFTGAHFKELFILTNVQGCNIDEAVVSMKKQFELFLNNKREEYYG